MVDGGFIFVLDALHLLYITGGVIVHVIFTDLRCILRCHLVFIEFVTSVVFSVSVQSSGFFLSS